MPNLIYGVCLDGGEVETLDDADKAMAKAHELKLRGSRGPRHDLPVGG